MPCSQGINLCHEHVYGYCPCNGYDLRNAIGLESCVQCTLVRQVRVAIIFQRALAMICDQDLEKFAFMCHGATHRSVACAVLFARMAFPHAIIAFSTNRVALAARDSVYLDMVSF